MGGLDSMTRMHSSSRFRHSDFFIGGPHQISQALDLADAIKGGLQAEELAEKVGAGCSAQGADQLLGDRADAVLHPRDVGLRLADAGRHVFQLVVAGADHHGQRMGCRFDLPDDLRRRILRGVVNAESQPQFFLVAKGCHVLPIVAKRVWVE